MYISPHIMWTNNYSPINQFRLRKNHPLTSLYIMAHTVVCVSVFSDASANALLQTTTFRILTFFLQYAYFTYNFSSICFISMLNEAFKISSFVMSSIQIYHKFYNLWHKTCHVVIMNVSFYLGIQITTWLLLNKWNNNSTNYMLHLHTYTQHVFLHIKATFVTEVKNV